MKCEDDKSRGDDELEPHEKMKRRFRDGEIRDRMQQTGLHYDHDFNEMQRMHPTQHGVWEHVSVYESRV